jgi:hypothetical protein
VGEPDVDVPCLSWGKRRPAAFAAAVSHWIHDVGVRGQGGRARGNSPTLSDVSAISPI